MLGDPAPTPFDPGVLRLTPDLRRIGVDPARSGWHHVRHGVWVEMSAWARLTPEQRHAALVHATDLVCRTPGEHVFALGSAAAVWGLPRVDRWPARVTVLESGAHKRGSRRIRVHLGAPADAVTVNGIRVTPPARTVVDVARTSSLATGLAAADHALRHGLCSAAELAAEAAEVRPRVLGRPAAHLVVELADARSMSPGESLSRAVMFRLNLPRPDLQVEVLDDDGLAGIADFGWPGVVGEFDGRRKYGIPEGADPAEASEVLWREKRREDRIRRRVRLARWVWDDARGEAPLAKILAEQGIRSMPRNTWFDLGSRAAS